MCSRGNHAKIVSDEVFLLGVFSCKLPPPEDVRRVSCKLGVCPDESQKATPATTPRKAPTPTIVRKPVPPPTPTISADSEELNDLRNRNDLLGSLAKELEFERDEARDNLTLAVAENFKLNETNQALEARATSERRKLLIWLVVASVVMLAIGMAVAFAFFILRDGKNAKFPRKKIVDSSGVKHTFLFKGAEYDRTLGKVVGLYECQDCKHLVTGINSNLRKHVCGINGRK
jgi:hypothetical protein